MTSLLTRIGSFEARLASKILWKSDKRKRGDWICAECRNRRAIRQTRAYSDDALRLAPEHYLFPPKESQNAEAEEQSPVKLFRLGRRTHPQRAGAWGLGAADVEVKREASTVKSEIDGLEDPKWNALWEQFEQTDDLAAEEADEQANAVDSDAASDILSRAGLLDIDYATELSPALTKNEPDQVARCLYAASRRDDVDFIRSIPTTTFAECIRILQPSNFIEPLASTHMELSETMTKQLGFAPIQRVAWRNAGVLREALNIRRAAGAKLGLPEYRMLLQSARDLCHTKLSERFWRELHEEGLTPDTSCYNAVIAANMWDGLHNTADRHNVRVIPFYQLARSRSIRGTGFQAYRVGDRGARSIVMKTFSEMLKAGVAADEESFRTVILAAAREGDVATIKSVMLKVWSIDIDALMSGADENAVTERPPDLDSSLTPTPALLFALAQAFSINNNIPTALRVVDFVARRYDIPISLAIWSQLFEWTFVLSKPRTGLKAQTDGTRTGQLPKESVLSLWETMTSSPYNVRPTMGMYNYLIKNMQHRDSPDMMYAQMQEGRKIYKENRRKAWLALAKLKRFVKDASFGSDAPTSLENIKRDFELADMIRKRDLFWVKRWLRLLLSTMPSFMRVNQTMAWTLQEIPQVLWEWRRWAPTVVRYECIGGVVEIEFRTKEEIEDDRRNNEHRVREKQEVLEKVPMFLSDE